jgi:hypothetical protein
MAKTNDGWEDAPTSSDWEDAPSGSLWDKAKGAGETALQVGTGFVGTVAGGFAGLGQTLWSGAEDGADTVHKVSKAMTYEPRGTTGKKYANKVGEVFEDATQKAAPWFESAAMGIPFFDKATGMSKDDNLRETIGRAGAEIGANFAPLDFPIRAVKGLHNLTKATDLDASARRIQGEQPAVHADGWEDAPASHNLKEVDNMFMTNPYDVGGHVSAMQEGRQTVLDHPQAEMFGRTEDIPKDSPRVLEPSEGYPPLDMSGVPPRLPETPRGEPSLPMVPSDHIPTLGENPQGSLPFGEQPLPRLEHPQFKERGLLDFADTPTWDNGTRHLDPTTGKVVQGMDASVPTVDFPLKTEQLGVDPKIQLMREQVAVQEHQLQLMRERGAHADDLARVQASVDGMRKKFGEYLSDAYGIEKREDAFPDLFEKGQGTKLPIKQTHQPTGGGYGIKAGKQRGAIDPTLLTFGVNKLIDWAKANHPVDGGRRILSKFVGTFKHEEIKRAVEDSVDPKSRERLYWMSPKEFHEAAYKRKDWMMNDAAEQKRESIRTGLAGKKGLDELPFLWIENGKVVGHEGRHRMDVFIEKGLDKIPVRIRDAAWRNEKGPLPYKELISENGVPIKMPEAIEGLKKVEEPKPSIMDRVRQQNENSNRMAAFTKQGGAVNLPEIKEGVKNLLDRFRPEQTKVAQEGVVLRPHLEALKNTAAGKGIADFMDWDVPPKEVIETAKQAVDIPDGKWEKIKSSIENGGVYRQVATKNPVIQAVTTWLNKAQEASDKLIREHLTDKDNGLQGKAQKLSSAEKGEVWSRLAMDEGQRVASADQLRSEGFSEAQIDWATKRRDIDKLVLDSVNEARAAKGWKPIPERIGHIAGRFMGDFRQMVYRAKLDKNGNMEIGPDGQAVREIVGVHQW